MAITVRFPNGQAVTYNRANFIVWARDVATLQVGKDGACIAFVPYSAGAIFEFENPCHVANPLVDGRDQVDLLIRDIRRIDGTQAKQLKQALAAFNCHTYRWREDER